MVSPHLITVQIRRKTDHEKNDKRIENKLDNVDKSIDEMKGKETEESEDREEAEKTGDAETDAKDKRINDKMKALDKTTKELDNE